MAAPPRLEARWAADPARRNGGQNAAAAPSLPLAFPTSDAFAVPDAAARLCLEQLRHDAAGFTNGAMMTGPQQISREQQWENGQQKRVAHATKRNPQQQPQRQEQQQQYQLPPQVSAPPANAHANAQSGNGGGAYRSSAVIQPGIAIVPQHYLPVPVEMPVLRPPTYPLPFVDSYSYTHSGFQLQSPQRGEQNRSQPQFFGNRQQQQTPITPSYAAPMTVSTYPPIAFVPFSAPDFAVARSANSSNYVVASHQFGDATWNREQHFSAAASAIDPRFSRDALQPQQRTAPPPMLLDQRHGNGWAPHADAYRQQQESQSAYYDAAATLYNLQSPVFSPRQTGNSITMESLLNSDTKKKPNAAKPTPRKPKAPKKALDIDAKGVELLLNMSVEKQNRVLNMAENTEIESDFLESLSRPQPSLELAPRGSNHQSSSLATQLQLQLQKQEQQQQMAFFPPYQIRPGMAIDARPLSGANVAAHAQTNLNSGDVGVKQKKAPAKRRRKQDAAQERTLHNAATLATNNSINVQSSASQNRPLSTTSITQQNSAQGFGQPANSGGVGTLPAHTNNSSGHSTTNDETKKVKAPVKRKRKQVVGAQPESATHPPPASALYERTTSGQRNLSPGFHMVWTLPDAQLTNLLSAAASASPSMAMNRAAQASNSIIGDAQHRQFVQPAAAISASSAASPSIQLPPSHPNGGNDPQPLKKPGPQQKKRSSAKGISMIKLNEEAKYIYATPNNGSQIPAETDAPRDQGSAVQGPAARASREKTNGDSEPMGARASLHVQMQQSPAMHDSGGMLPPAGSLQQGPELPAASQDESAHISQVAKELALGAAVLKISEPPVAADAVSHENSTVMIFCKRDFMRYQAVKLWKKFQEKKKKLEFTSTQVSGKRTRYHSARYGSQAHAAQPKPRKVKKLSLSKKTSNKETVESTPPSKENALAEETTSSANERIPQPHDQLPATQPPQSSEASSDRAKEHSADAKPRTALQLPVSSEHVSVKANKETESSAGKRTQHEDGSAAPSSTEHESSSTATSEGTNPASSAASAPQ